MIYVYDLCLGFTVMVFCAIEYKCLQKGVMKWTPFWRLYYISSTEEIWKSWRSRPPVWHNVIRSAATREGSTQARALEDLQTLELCAGQRPALAAIKQNRNCEGLISPGEDTTHVAPLFTPRKQRPQLGKSHASQANTVGNLQNENLQYETGKFSQFRVILGEWTHMY